MRICIGMCMHHLLYICIHICIYIYICTYIYIFTYTHIYIYIHTYTHKYIYIYTYTHIYIYIYIYIYVHTHIHIHTYTYTYTYTYAYTLQFHHMKWTSHETSFAAWSSTSGFLEKKGRARVCAECASHGRRSFQQHKRWLGDSLGPLLSPVDPLRSVLFDQLGRVN